MMVRNFAYFYHIFLDPALAPSQASGVSRYLFPMHEFSLDTCKTLTGHIPTLKTANWAVSEIFAEFMLFVSKVIRLTRLNVSMHSMVGVFIR